MHCLKVLEPAYGSGSSGNSRAPSSISCCWLLSSISVLWVHEGAKTAPFEAIAIALILVLNAGFGAYQEGKAEEALARLKALGMPLVWAMRECSLAQLSNWRTRSGGYCSHRGRRPGAG